MVPVFKIDAHLRKPYSQMDDLCKAVEDEGRRCSLYRGTI